MMVKEWWNSKTNYYDSMVASWTNPGFPPRCFGGDFSTSDHWLKIQVHPPIGGNMKMSTCFQLSNMQFYWDKVVQSTACVRKRLLFFIYPLAEQIKTWAWFNSSICFNLSFGHTFHVIPTFKNQNTHQNTNNKTQVTEQQNSQLETNTLHQSNNSERKEGCGPSMFSLFITSSFLPGLRFPRYPVDWKIAIISKGKKTWPGQIVGWKKRPQ